MVTPTFCISLNFFPKSLGIIDTEGIKKKIIIIISIHFLIKLFNTFCFTYLHCLMSWWIQGLSRTCVMKFKEFQAPVLFSSTFNALNLGEKLQVLSRTFKDAWEPCQPQKITIMLDTVICYQWHRFQCTSSKSYTCWLKIKFSRNTKCHITSITWAVRLSWLENA